MIYVIRTEVLKRALADADLCRELDLCLNWPEMYRKIVEWAEKHGIPTAELKAR